MRTDNNGISSIKPGQEQWEEFYSSTSQATRVQYDYRTPDGVLFSCVALNLDHARAKRDAWLLKRKTKPSEHEKQDKELQ